MKKKIELVRLPKIIIIQLLRFSRNGTEHQKNECHVDFDRTIDLSPFVTACQGKLNQHTRYKLQRYCWDTFSLCLIVTQIVLQSEQNQSRRRFFFLSSQTTLIDKVLPVYWLGRWPEHTIVMTSYGPRDQEQSFWSYLCATQSIGVKVALKEQIETKIAL